MGLPPLVSADELAGALDRDDIVVLDGTTRLAVSGDGVPYTVTPDRDGFLAAHVPSARFANVEGLSDPSGRFVAFLRDGRVILRDTHSQLETDLSATGADGRDTIRINLQQLQSGGASARNVDLRDGDTIYVARAEVVYVFGHVKNPGSYPIKSHTTVLQALALAGGVMPSGAMNRTKVLRIVGGDKREIKVKPTDIVQAGDTIVVPERYF